MPPACHGAACRGQGRWSPGRTAVPIRRSTAGDRGPAAPGPVAHDGTDRIVGVDVEDGQVGAASGRQRSHLTTEPQCGRPDARGRREQPSIEIRVGASALDRHLPQERHVGEQVERVVRAQRVGARPRTRCPRGGSRPPAVRRCRPSRWNAGTAPRSCPRRRSGGAPTASRYTPWARCTSGPISPDDAANSPARCPTPPWAMNGDGRRLTTLMRSAHQPVPAWYSSSSAAISPTWLWMRTPSRRASSTAARMASGVTLYGAWGDRPTRAAGDGRGGTEHLGHLGFDLVAPAVEVDADDLEVGDARPHRPRPARPSRRGR